MSFWDLCGLMGFGMLGAMIFGLIGAGIISWRGEHKKMSVSGKFLLMGVSPLFVGIPLSAAIGGQLGYVVAISVTSFALILTIAAAIWSQRRRRKLR